MPWFLVPDDGVEDGEEFAGGGDGGDHFGFAGGHEAVAEGLEHAVVPDGSQGCHEQGGAHGLAAAGDAGAIYGRAAFAGDRSNADESGDLAAIERADFGQASEDHLSVLRADAFARAQETGFFGQNGVGSAMWASMTCWMASI